MPTRLLYLFLLLVNINIMFAQTTYDLFTIKGLKYGIIYVDSYSNDKISNHSTFYDGDTTINGVPLISHAQYTYTLNKQYLHVNEKKVYYFDKGTESLILLYDFALQVNDTFKYNGLINYIVQKKEINTYGDGKSRIYLKLKSQFSNTTLEWIEGIGDINLGPFNYNYIHKYDLRFICSSNDDGIIFNTEGKNSQTCKDSLFCKNAIALFSTSEDDLKINFDNNSLNSNGQLWDFGDGTFSTELNPVHTFGSPGCKEITLKAISACGDTSITSNGINYCLKGDWEEAIYLNLETSPSEVNFIDDKKLWVMTRYSILFSQNGGITFDNISPDIKPKTIIKKLYFDGETGVVLVQSRVGNKGYFEVYFSEDAGETWTITQQGFGESGSLFHNYTTNTFVFTLSSSTTSDVFLSIDNGRNWNDLTLSESNYNYYFHILENSSLIVKYQNTINNQTEYFLGISRDFGLTWDIISTILYRISYFINENLSFFISDDNEFLVSNDLLKTHTSIFQFPPDFYPNQLYFLSPKIGFVNSFQYSFYTIDGGKTWMSSNCEKNDFAMIKVDQNNEIFALGWKNNIYRFSPPEIDDRCTKSSTNYNSDIGDNLLLFPNPVLEGNVVEFVNSTDNNLYFVNLFTSLGIQIVNQKLYTNTIDTSQLSPGLYFVVVKNKSFRILKTMTLIIL